MNMDIYKLKKLLNAQELYIVENTGPDFHRDEPVAFPLCGTL